MNLILHVHEKVQHILYVNVLYVNKIDYLLLKLFVDDLLKMLILVDELNELVKLIKDDLMVYYNDQDKEVYEEIFHFYYEDEEDHNIL
jgi:hypothetical protein